MNRAETIRHIQLLEEQTRRNKANTLQRVYDSFYPWQREFNAATKNHKACMLMAANQVGKSRTGLTMDANHLLGDYPDDWEGIRFESPPMCWLLGLTGEKTRDLLQNKLFGRYDGTYWEGGLISKDRILDHKSMGGTSGAMREVRVQNHNGKATCQFWSYSQGQHAIMGDKVDWYHIDEEPEDAEIFPQVVTRTLNGNNGLGGHGILTFTPENGMTQLVCKFMGTNYEGADDEEETDLSVLKGMHLLTATWDDAPHLNDEMKEAILSIYPAYQRPMRSKGVPLMGSGLIYPYDEENLYVDPFEVPDYWFVIDAMDFGWDHPQAHLQLVWNRDADEYTVINVWKGSKKQPYEAWHCIKPWAQNVPTAWPHDGLQTEKGSGKTQASYYEEAGFRLLPEHAQWEDGGNSVWAGIQFIDDLIKTNRLKVVRTLRPFFEEFRQYHTKTTKAGKVEIVKSRDDLMDCLRYAIMMIRYSIRVCDLNPQQQPSRSNRADGRNKTTGY